MKQVVVQSTKKNKVTSLKDINAMVREKRATDLFRFRTCCCDPRASK